MATRAQAPITGIRMGASVGALHITTKPLGLWWNFHGIMRKKHVFFQWDPMGFFSGTIVTILYR